MFAWGPTRVYETVGSGIVLSVLQGRRAHDSNRVDHPVMNSRWAASRRSARGQLALDMTVRD